MTGYHAALGAPIPLQPRIFGWLLVGAGLFFGWVYAAAPGLFFPGVSIESYSEQFGLYSTTVRILGSVLGIVIALLLNSAGLLALMLATRIFIELGDVIVGLIVNQGAADANTAILSALAAIEAWFLLVLIRHIRAQGSNAADAGS